MYSFLFHIYCTCHINKKKQQQQAVAPFRVGGCLLIKHNIGIPSPLDWLFSSPIGDGQG